MYTGSSSSPINSMNIECTLSGTACLTLHASNISVFVRWLAMPFTPFTMVPASPMIRQAITRPIGVDLLRSLIGRHHSLRTSTVLQTRPISQQDTNQRKQQSTTNQTSPYPSLSFAGLGASRAVKVTVLIGLGVIGTMETVFWTKALWQYFSPTTDTTLKDEEKVQERAA